jgi:restriction endonuclease Mrr
MVHVPDSLGLPTQARVEAELLKLLASRSRAISTNDVYRVLADACDLTAAQRAAPTKGGRAEPVWRYRVRWAMEHIEGEGWALRPGRWRWAATAKGRTLQTAREQAGSVKIVGAIGHDLFGSETDG